VGKKSREIADAAEEEQEEATMAMVREDAP